ncbi:MAG: hypothetical protein ACOVOO_01510 [Flavobacteriales bacterium]
MLVQAAPIAGLTPDQYDAFLESGWFRGSSMIYRSEFVCLDKQVLSIINIRLPLGGYHFRKSQRRVMRKADSRFRVEVTDPIITPEKEALYQSNFDRFKAFIHSSLEEIVLGQFVPIRLNTKEIAVYDGDRLIALSYFDVGARSAAGILGVFDHEYASYSLGYFTMLKEVEWCVAHDIKWYYPGYIMDQSAEFDYKLRLGEMEWMVGPKQWTSFENDVRNRSKANVLRKKLAQLGVYFRERGVPYKEKIYPYFTTGHLIQTDDLLLRVPNYLEIKDEVNTYAATYDIEKGGFVLFTIEATTTYDHFLNLNVSEDYKDTECYEMRLMRVIAASPIPFH